MKLAVVISGNLPSKFQTTKENMKTTEMCNLKIWNLKRIKYPGNLSF